MNIAIFLGYKTTLRKKKLEGQKGDKKRYPIEPSEHIN